MSKTEPQANAPPASIEPAPPVEADIEAKGDHLSNPDSDANHILVSDTDAKNYVDPSVVISEEENKRLRWKIHKRYVARYHRVACFIATDSQSPPAHVPCVHHTGAGQADSRPCVHYGLDP